jgi:hypothetical protein
LDQAPDAAAAAHAELAQEFARKDANEVLVKDGAQVLVAYLEAAQPLPIRGLFTFMDFWPQVGCSSPTSKHENTSSYQAVQQGKHVSCLSAVADCTAGLLPVGSCR